MLKSIHRHFRWRFENFYSKSHWHLVLELSLAIIIIFLAASLTYLYLYRPNLPGFGYYARPVIDINNPPLALEFVPESMAVDLEEGAHLKVSFKNNGAAVISNFTLTLESVDKNFSVQKIESADDNPGIKIDNQTISFPKIASGASGEANLKVSFKAEGEGRTINWQARSVYDVSGQIVSGNISLPSLQTEAKLIIKDTAYYTSPQGDQLGIGPLPPLVGIPTNYWIFWEAQSLDDWKNLVMSAHLPKGVELTDSRSLLAGDFNYNPDTRIIIWKIPTLDGRVDNYRLGFEVQLIPTASQVGEVLPLLSGAKYYATDSLTGLDVNGDLDEPTTNLNKDRFNAGHGQVVAE